MIFRQLTNRAARPESYRSVIFLRQCRWEVQHLLKFLTSALLLRKKVNLHRDYSETAMLAKALIYAGGRKIHKVYGIIFEI